MQSKLPYEKVIGVFGSANTQPGTPDYTEAVTLGAALAGAGYAVMTGGYGGVMGAISQGAAEAHGHAIGVTVGLFKSRGLIPNSFLHEEVHLPTLAERLNYLIVKPDAYVVLKGGAGTLSEMALAWSLLQVGEVPPRPLVLVGAMWRELIPHFATVTTITQQDIRLLTLVDRGDEVVPALTSWWANPPQVPLRLGDVQKTPPLGDNL
ncbi:MAG: LOG family protein [Chloroflexota bacterium]